jgi:hypothetical protein
MKFLLSLLLAANCTNATEPAATPAVAPPRVAPPAPSKPGDRSTDPAFVLREVGGRYVGRVADRCPDGTREHKPKAWTLADGTLSIELFFGGCPRWNPYTVVTGPGSPLAFHLCEDIAADRCEMDGRKTWTFDISAALAANHATAVEYAVPAGVP